MKFIRSWWCLFGVFVLILVIIFAVFSDKAEAQGEMSDYFQGEPQRTMQPIVCGVPSSGILDAYKKHYNEVPRFGGFDINGLGNDMLLLSEDGSYTILKFLQNGQACVFSAGTKGFIDGLETENSPEEEEASSRKGTN